MNCEDIRNMGIGWGRDFVKDQPEFRISGKLGVEILRPEEFAKMLLSVQPMDDDIFINVYEAFKAAEGKSLTMTMLKKRSSPGAFKISYDFYDLRRFDGKI